MEATREVDELDLPWKAALDVDAFAKLSEADLGYATHAAVTPIGLESSQRQEQTPSQHPRPGATPTQRFKRKNFNKQETQQLLQQSYLQFLKEGGALDEPRFTYEEFLKLIRNRRREINARAQRPLKQGKEDQAMPKKTTLTPAKKKLHEEHAKIREFIEIIDRTREQAGLIPDTQQQNRSLKSSAVEMVMVPSSQMMVGLTSLQSEPMEQMEAILQIHQETREVQREIAVRLRSISRVIRQHEGHDDLEEPSSASV